MAATELEEAGKAFQECEKQVQAMLGSQQAFISQLNENHMVRAELDILEDEAEVFKAVGPVLLKIDVDDAKASVKQRIERLTKEVEKTEKALREKIEEKNKLQQNAMQLQMKQQQEMQKQQQQASS